MNLFCPIMSKGEKELVPCIEERCQLWDGAVFDEYCPGCGLVDRSNRRV